MTTEAIAIIAPIVAAVLIVGINAWLQVRINEQALISQRRLAAQERSAATYVDMLEMVGLQMEVVEATKPFFTRGKPPEPPSKPDDEHLRKMQARIGAHGSPEVKKALAVWAEKRNRFFDDAELLELIEKDRSNRDPEKVYGISLPKLRERFDTTRRELRDLVRALEDTVSAELRG